MSHQESQKAGLKIVRDFKAPIDLVFKAFSQPQAFAQWWGPAGMPVSINRFDFKKGGVCHYKMEGNGQVMWGLFKYQNISEPDLIEFVSSFSDEKGNVCSSPFPMDFPLEILNRVTLTEKNGVTTLTLDGHPINATPDQEATYHS
ncbi:MAG: SRPBCC domain-containing protein, partial [Gemmatimonadaceae bacterium]|nr:SRPBCC domain-containing protein [Chitinophagaceae bacterium]